MNPEPANMDEVAQYWIDEAEEALRFFNICLEELITHTRFSSGISL